jgi:hypothetical protein
LPGPEDPPHYEFKTEKDVTNAILAATAAAEKASLAIERGKHPLPGPDDPPWKFGSHISVDAVTDLAAAVEEESRRDEHPHPNAEGVSLSVASNKKKRTHATAHVDNEEV